MTYYQNQTSKGILEFILRIIMFVLSMLVAESNQLLVASTVMSTQLVAATGLVMSQIFGDDEVVTLEITTDRVCTVFVK